jgi:hypothetical protein
MVEKKEGSKIWYFADGYLPLKGEKNEINFEGHEAIMILNCNDKDVNIKMDIFFEDKEPVTDILLVVPARRVKCFRMDKPEDIGGFKIKNLYQYALRFKSDLEVIIQYGRMDITMDNLAYIGLMGYTG